MVLEQAMPKGSRVFEFGDIGAVKDIHLKSDE
jgi:hypothetical protein